MIPIVNLKGVVYNAALFAIDYVADQAAYLGRSLRKSDGIDRIGKVACAIIDVLSLFLGKDPAGQSLRGHVKEFREIFTTAQLAIRLQEWVGNKPGTDLPFWKTENSVVVVAHAIFTAAQTLEAVHFLSNVGALNLGKISEKLGSLPFLGTLANSPYPILSIIKDILYMISSGMLVIDRAFIIHKARKRGAKIDNKIEKWDIRKQIIETAFPEAFKAKRNDDDNDKPGSIASRSNLLASRCNLLDQYETKIVIGQLELQNSMLEYVVHRDDLIKGECEQQKSVVSYKGQEAPGYNMVRLQSLVSEQQLRIAGFIKNITGIETNVFPSSEGMKEYFKMSNIIQQEMKQLETYMRTVPMLGINMKDVVQLRDAILTLSFEVGKLNQHMIAKSRDISEAEVLPQNKEFKLKEKLSSIDRMHSQLTKWENIYDAIGLYDHKEGREDKIVEMLQTYTWKTEKWKVEQFNNDITKKKAWWFLIDMSCKFIGASFSLSLHFAPPVKVAFALAEAGFIVLSAAVPKVVEITKTFISVISALVSYASGYDTELLQKKAIPIRPIGVKVKPRVNPIKVNGGVMEALVVEDKKPPVSRDDLLEMQIKVVNNVSCKRGLTRLRVPRAAVQ